MASDGVVLPGLPSKQSDTEHEFVLLGMGENRLVR